MEDATFFPTPPAGRQDRALTREGRGGGGRRLRDTHLSLFDPLPRIRPPTQPSPTRGEGEVTAQTPATCVDAVALKRGRTSSLPPTQRLDDLHRIACAERVGHV